MAINVVERIDEDVKIRNVLMSVSDKTGLDRFAQRLIEINPDLRILSTGGTYDAVQQALGTAKSSRHLIQVSEYTGQPETQGGLVKTLDFKIYLGLLSETYNDAHRRDMERTGAVAIDMVVVNLYPFAQTIAKPGATVEHARGNIDIGGPCMVRAAAKNFIRVASVTDPSDYDRVLAELLRTRGALTLRTRFDLAHKAFAHTAAYDAAIARYFEQRNFEDVFRCYRYV